MKNFKKIFVGSFFLSLMSLPLYSLDDDCDILCRAGLESKNSSQNKPEPKPEIKKTYIKPRSYSSYNQSNIIIKNTESTKKDIADIKNWFYKNIPDLSRAPYDIDISITSAFGLKDNFSIEDLNFSVIEKYDAKRYGIATIGSYACNGSYVGYGINEARPIELMLKELEFPKPISSSDSYSCKLEDISLDLNGIAGLNGQSLEDLVYDLEYEIGERPADIVIGLLKNNDLYFEAGATYNQNLWRASNKIIYSLGNSSVSIFADAEVETDMSFMHELLSVFKTFLTSVAGREMMNDLANAPGIFPLDQYMKIAMKINENQYEDSFYEALERLQSSMMNLGLDLQTGNSSEMELDQKIYKFSFGISWSDQIFREAAYASGGTIDAGLLFAKGLMSNKMNKYEIQMLLQNAGLDRNLQGLYLDYVYTLYDQVYEQARIFINNPRGLLIELEFPLGLDQKMFYEIDQNPMMAFNVLNNMEFSITANPIFKN